MGHRQEQQNKFEKTTVMVALATTIHYMLYCKIVFNRFHGRNLKTI